MVKTHSDVLNTVTFRVQGKMHNLKNEHRAFVAKDGRPGIRRDTALKQWMTQTATEISTQLSRQIASAEKAYPGWVSDFPRARKPFDLYVGFWRDKPWGDKDRDGQLNAILDILQGVVYQNDSWQRQIVYGVAKSPLIYTDIVVVFHDGALSMQELRALLPQVYV